MGLSLDAPEKTGLGSALRGRVTSARIAVLLVALSMCAALTAASPVPALGQGTEPTPFPSPTPAPSATATGVFAGEDVSCAVTDQGSVLCWGGLFESALDGRAVFQTAIPTSLNDFNFRTASLAIGEHFGCALTDVGGVECWGEGLLGDGQNHRDGASPPVPVLGLTEGVHSLAVTTSGHDACAVTSDGSLMCWGDDLAGGSGVPKAVGGLSGVAQVAAGDDFMCALVAGGAVKCWGGNTYGQLGDGSGKTGGLGHGGKSSDTPVDALGVKGATQISAGGHNSCALIKGGSVKCWGSSTQGGAYSDAYKPVAVKALGPGNTAIATDSYQSCAIGKSGDVKCWDRADGDPADVGSLNESAVAIAAGSGHACALLKSGHIACWGSNDQGQLGSSSNVSSGEVVAVPGIGAAAALPSGDFQAVAIGGSHVCAITASGGVKCWGDNYRGQLGSGSTDQPEPRDAPVDVYGLDSGVTAIVAGGDESCALVNGGVSCWGNEHLVPEAMPGLESGVRALAGGGSWDEFGGQGPGFHTCALLEDQTVTCWQGFGETYGCSGQSCDVPAPVPDLQGITALAVGGLHACGLTATGAVRCWGADSSNQLGDRKYKDSATPVDVAGLSDIASIGAGANHTCAVSSSGRIKCWGKVNGDSFPVGDVGGITTEVTSVAGGGAHTCVLTTGGGVKCWGRGDAGQLGWGRGSYDGDSDQPVDVVGLSSGVSAIAAGGETTCAVTTGGGLMCWGRRVNSLTPVAVPATAGS